MYVYGDIMNPEPNAPLVFSCGVCVVLLSARRRPGRLELHESLNSGTGGLTIILLTPLMTSNMEIEMDQACPALQCEFLRVPTPVIDDVGVVRNSLGFSFRAHTVDE